MTYGADFCAQRAGPIARRARDTPDRRSATGETTRIVRQRLLGDMRGEHGAGMRRHHTHAGQRAQDVRSLNGKRSDERTILRRLAVIAAVDDSAVAARDVRCHPRNHPRTAAKHDLGVLGVELRWPDERPRRRFECPYEIKLIAVREVDRPYVDPARKHFSESPRFRARLELAPLGRGPVELRFVDPDEKRRVATDGPGECRAVSPSRAAH
jgi:hypothetical protein